MKWNEYELETRDSIIKYFTRHLDMELGDINPGFKFMRIETPILLPFSVESTAKSVQIVLDNHDLTLRQNTVTGAYETSSNILNGKAGPKQRLPLVIWQHGKIFKPQGKKIEELYSLEYQILFSKTTAVVYDPYVLLSCTSMLTSQCGPISEESTPTGMNLRAVDTGDTLMVMHRRDDFFAGNNLEVVFNMDLCTKASIRKDTSRKRALTRSTCVG